MRLRWLVLAGVLATVLPFGGPSSATATSCPAGRFCVYKGTLFQGEFRAIRNVPGTFIKLTGSFNNTVSSADNERPRVTFLYDGQTLQSNRICIPVGPLLGDRPDLATQGFDDVTSAIFLSKRTTCPT